MTFTFPGDVVAYDGARTSRGLFIPGPIKQPITPAMFGAPTDGIAPADAAVRAAAAAAVSKGVPLLIDRPYAFSSKWTPPAGLTLVGSGLGTASVLLWKGVGDAIEITGPIHIDGITVDGGVPAGQDRTTSCANVLVGIHGPIDLTSPRLSGVMIGALCVRNTRSVGFVAANIEELQIGHLDLKTIYTGGSYFSGLTNANIDLITADDIGNTKRFISRQGTAVAVMTETKALSPWYVQAGIKPTDGITFGNVAISRTTDSAFYIHDDLKTGVTNIHCKSVSVDTAGKDGWKTRNGPTHVTLDKLVTNKTSLRGLDIESDYTTVGTVSISNVGYDAVGDILGVPSPYTGTDGTNESMQAIPDGLMVSSCSHVSIQSISISRVKASPYNAEEGHGFRFIMANGLKIGSGSVATCDGNGMRMSGCLDVVASLSITDPCRNTPNGVGAYVNSDGYGNSGNCTLDLTVVETGTPSVPTAIRLNDSYTMAITPHFDPAQFTGTPFIDNSTSAV